MQLKHTKRCVQCMGKGRCCNWSDVSKVICEVFHAPAFSFNKAPQLGRSVEADSNQIETLTENKQHYTILFLLNSETINRLGIITIVRLLVTSGEGGDWEGTYVEILRHLQYLIALGSGRSPREGMGCPLQYSCLGNSMDRGALWATVHRATKSWTWKSNWTHTYIK